MRDPWVDIEAAAVRLASIYDGAEVVSEVRRMQWQRRIWVWIHRARLSGDPVPASQRRGRRLHYRLSELEEFVEKRVRCT